MPEEVDKEKLQSSLPDQKYDASDYDNASVLDTSLPHRPWYDIFNPKGFKRPPDNELGFDTTGLSRAEISLEQMSRAAPALSQRHLIIITATAGIGTGLFVGSGTALKEGGPAGLIIAYGLLSISLLSMMLGIAEMALRYPTVSPFNELTARFIDPSLGFAIGWIFMAAWLVTAPLEIIVSAELTRFWKSDDNPAAQVNPVAWVSLIYVFDVFIQIYGGTRAYGELEFFVGFLKLFSVVAFIIFTIIHVAGGIPGAEHSHVYDLILMSNQTLATQIADNKTLANGTSIETWVKETLVPNDYFSSHKYIGGHYFFEPGAFATSFKGVIGALISAAFAFGGTEIAALASVETANPVRVIPSTTRQTFWRLMLFFITAVILIGLSVPSSIDGLGSSNDGTGSPFIISLQRSFVYATPSLFNSLILCSVIGVSNAAIYSCTRLLVGLSISGMGPSWLSYIDRHGRPIFAKLAVLTFTLLCFVCASDKYNDVFNWLYAFGALGWVYLWATLPIVHIMFRIAMKLQGRSTSELLYKSPLGVAGSAVGSAISIFVLVMQFWTSGAPIGGSSDAAEYFFQQDLSVPCVIALFVGHKIYLKKTTGSWGFINLKTMDLDAGVRDLDMDMVEHEELMARERARKNFLIRLGHIFC